MDEKIVKSFTDGFTESFIFWGQLGAVIFFLAMMVIGSLVPAGWIAEAIFASSGCCWSCPVGACEHPVMFVSSAAIVLIIELVLAGSVANGAWKAWKTHKSDR